LPHRIDNSFFIFFSKKVGVIGAGLRAAQDENFQRYGGRIARGVRLVSVTSFSPELLGAALRGFRFRQRRDACRQVL